jgi:hypothetical protein
MSALGINRHFAAQTSDLRPKADMCDALAHVRFGSKADMSSDAVSRYGGLKKPVRGGLSKF